MTVLSFPVFPAVRHVRLSEAHVRALFGPAAVRVVHSLGWGDGASDAFVDVEGPSGRMRGVRVVLPYVVQSRVALLQRDAARLGLFGPLPTTTTAAPGCTLHGPVGVVVLAGGVVAAEHVMLPPGVVDNSVVVDVVVDGDRPRTLRRVPVLRGPYPRLFISDELSPDDGTACRAHLP